MIDLSSSLSGLTEVLDHVFFDCTGEPCGFDETLETLRSEELEQVSRVLRPPALGARRTNFEEDEVEVEVEGFDFGECWSESVESSEGVTRTAGDPRRGGCVGVLIASGSFPFHFPSFMSLDKVVDDGRRESERCC